MGAGVINVPIPIQDRMVGFVMNAKIWLFANEFYNPSYWLILKREGFSGNLAYGSVELTYDLYDFDRDALMEIYRIHHGEFPNNKNAWQLHFEVEQLILSSRISVFVLELDLLTRVGDAFDPLMNESQGFYDTGTPIVATRNLLAEELGNIIGTRWLGKDSADKLHWDRSVITREMIERYDVRAAVVDTAVDFVVGLWELGKFVVTLSAGVLEFKLQIITKAVTGDFKGIKDQLLQLGIDSVNSVEDAISKAKQGYEILQRINDDPQSKALLYDFFDSLYQSIHYRDTRTIGIRIITVIGIEVLIALATAGAGNIARIAAMSAARLARGTASVAKNIGPFTLKSIDLLGDLAKRLKSNTKIPDEDLELPPVEPIKVPESGKLGVDKNKTEGGAKGDLVGEDGGFKALGITVDPKASLQGRLLMQQYQQQYPDMSAVEIQRLARSTLETGDALPSVSIAKPGDTFYKLIPTAEARGPSPGTVYWMDASQLDDLVGGKNDIGSSFGLPNQTTASTYKVYQTSVREAQAPLIFRANVAPVVDDGVYKVGGQNQSLLPKRSAFSEPSQILDGSGNPLIIQSR